VKRDRIEILLVGALIVCTFAQGVVTILLALNL
jgi:hypothetical protein